ncbi:trafficking regulator of GLUT4 1 [Lepus europaeus]|uniref:trafficking regulator of GLUT4 1 n=1 Tax=Lepus europaeus TaxID=9983 RepID=UPI002B461370|nr:trafficking regulator of GLUT4 1 [Lepus europaeus]
MANPVQPQFPLVQEAGSTSPLELPEMEKLLTKVADKDDKALGLSRSLSGALDLENGHSLPFKVISERHREASLPRSPSRASSRRASSIATTSYAQDQEVPKDYLILAIASCFCPVWPLNLIPLIFSIMSRSSVQQGDLDGARRLGRMARLLSITFIIMGIIIIIVAVTVNLTGFPVTDRNSGCLAFRQPSLNEKQRERTQATQKFLSLVWVPQGSCSKDSEASGREEALVPSGHSWADPGVGTSAPEAPNSSTLALALAALARPCASHPSNPSELQALCSASSPAGWGAGDGGDGGSLSASIPYALYRWNLTTNI